MNNTRETPEAIELLRQSIEYNEETGACIWINRPLSHFPNETQSKFWNANFPGKPAGGISPCDTKLYYKIGFQRKQYKLHRVIWAIKTGEWPNEIDHKDGDGLNNRWENLRNVIPAINRRNTRKTRKGDLPTGVRAEAGKFRATIQPAKLPMMSGR